MVLELAGRPWSWNLRLLDIGTHNNFWASSGIQFFPVCILFFSTNALDPIIIVCQIWVGDCCSSYSLDDWPDCEWRRCYVGPPDKFYQLFPATGSCGAFFSIGLVLILRESRVRWPVTILERDSKRTSPSVCEPQPCLRQMSPWERPSMDISLRFFQLLLGWLTQMKKHFMCHKYFSACSHCQNEKRIH